MTKYQYTGPLSAIKIGGKSQGHYVELFLTPGKVLEDVDVSLPYFKRLIARGHLKAMLPGEVVETSPLKELEKTQVPLGQDPTLLGEGGSADGRHRADPHPKGPCDTGISKTGEAGAISSKRSNK